MAAALGHDLLADTRQRDQSRLISLVLLFALLTGGARVFWKSSRQDDEWEIAQHMGCTGPLGAQHSKLLGFEWIVVRDVHLHCAYDQARMRCASAGSLSRGGSFA
jgi:hypothetical protein